MASDGLAARKAALGLLDQVLGQGRLMSDVIAGGALASLAPDDRARAQRLATQTLRHLERADRVLKPFLRKTPPLPVHNILRLATVELCQGGASHGVVNEAVTLVSRTRRHGALKGLANAVLRKVAASGPKSWETLRPSRLPRWLRDPLVAAWGADAVRAMEAAHAAGAPLDITPREEGVMPDGLGEPLPTGSFRLAEPGQVSALPGFEAGQWWVQDAAAALPARILSPQAGDRVLDMCAAPGGKTLQLAAAGAQVTALDQSAQRLERLRENLDRTGLKADVVVGDALEHDGQFDAVLLDAPCSATGTLRRHPDLPFAKDGADIGGLIDLQSRMLDRAIALTRPGGRIVFCTCSLIPDEGEVQAEEALVRHKGLKVDRTAPDRPGVDPAWITDEGGLRLRPDYWPERGGMDGFYIICLTKSN